MAERGDDGMFVDHHGNKYVNETEADSVMSDAAAGKSGGGGGGGAMGGMAGVFALIFIIGPIIAATIVGFLWGLLLKLGIVGKIITTALMLVIGPIMVIVPSVFIFSSPAVKDTLGWVGANVIPLTLIVGSALIFSTWYYFWHYDVVKAMGTSVFSDKVKKFAMITWFGYIGAAIISIFAGTQVGVVIMLLAYFASIVYYLFSTAEYKQEAERTASFKFRWIGMAGAVGLTVVCCIFLAIGEKIEAAQRVAQKTAELEMSLTDQTATTKVQINLRAEPSSNGRLIKTLAKDSPLTLKSELSGMWIQAENSGDLGWVLAPFVNMDYQRDIFGYKSLYPFEATTTAATQLYEDAKKTESAGNLPQGSTITVIQTSGEYGGYISIEIKNREYVLPEIAAENIIPKLNANGSIATIADKPKVFDSRKPVNATVTEDIVAWHIDTRRYIEIPKGAAVTVTNEYSNVTYDGKKVRVKWWYLKPAN